MENKIPIHTTRQDESSFVNAFMNPIKSDCVDRELINLPARRIKQRKDKPNYEQVFKP
jgi:CRISPR/Cas system-associated endonuclease Cas1